MEKRQPFQQLALEQVDKLNETQLIPHTLYKNSLEMDKTKY